MRNASRERLASPIGCDVPGQRSNRLLASCIAVERRRTFYSTASLLSLGTPDQFLMSETLDLAMDLRKR